MIPIPSDVAEKINYLAQVPATAANPQMVLWLQRSDAPLTDGSLLESQEVTVAGRGFGAVDIAARHNRFGRESDRIYLAYIQNNTVYTTYAEHTERMERHIWRTPQAGATATDVSIEFDATVRTNQNGRQEYVTEDVPWVFWVDAGKCYGQHLNSNEQITIANANCTAVSAVRLAWSEGDNFNFGLCVFFLMDGDIYYRQLINGTWYDAEYVPFGTGDTVWVDIAASRTWDYRAVLQLLDSRGNLHELYGEFGGIGARNQEHISITGFMVTGGLTRVAYTNTNEAEHIAVRGISAQSDLWYALTSDMVSARNIDAMTIIVTFNHPLVTVTGNEASFTVTDGYGGVYPVAALSLSNDGMQLTVSAADFNGAYGTTITVSYTPGTVECKACPLEACSVTFTPTGLIPQNPAEVVEVTNI